MLSPEEFAAIVAEISARHEAIMEEIMQIKAEMVEIKYMVED